MIAFIFRSIWSSKCWVRLNPWTRTSLFSIPSLLHVMKSVMPPFGWSNTCKGDMNLFPSPLLNFSWWLIFSSVPKYHCAVFHTSTCSSRKSIYWSSLKANDDWQWEVKYVREGKSDEMYDCQIEWKIKSKEIGRDRARALSKMDKCVHGGASELFSRGGSAGVQQWEVVDIVNMSLIAEVLPPPCSI